MRVPTWRSVLLLLCTISTFVVIGRAPGAVNLRLRDIETAVASEGKSARDKRSQIARPDLGNSA